MEIVDKSGLIEILNISNTTLRKQWKSWPHFFVCPGKDLRSARFNLEKVITFLENQNADTEQNESFMDGKHSKARLSKKGKKGFQNEVRGKRMGKTDMVRDDSRAESIRKEILSCLH